MSYQHVDDHHSMVFDHYRNSFYEKAIMDAVTPASVVLDLGAGLGLHGFIAARAGAAKVYLVDPSPVIFMARQVAEDNGLDNVECIQSSAEDLVLPDKVDIIVSVLTGNFLLTEDLLPTLFSARDKFLRAGGTMIPDRANMMVAPVSIPEFYEKNVACWRDAETDLSLSRRYRIDFKSVAKFAENLLFYDYYQDIAHQFLGEPATIRSMDFGSAQVADCFERVHVGIQHDAVCHGWLGWFDARLGSDWLSTSPAKEKTHWRQVFLPLQAPLEVHRGDLLSLELKRPEHSHWAWATRLNDHSRIRSTTFLANPPQPGLYDMRLEQKARTLNREGRLLQWVLGQLEAGAIVGELASEVRRKNPQKFRDENAALRFLRNVAKQFGDPRDR